MASVIPGLLTLCDVDDVAQLLPDAVLLVCGEGDELAGDAGAVARAAGLAHTCRGDVHALDTDRFEIIVEWLAKAAATRT